ncbi:tetratricopeptide repeat protein, partial [Methylomagnum sp.]
QGRYSEALSIYTAARDSFAALDEPSEVAAAWHQIGRVHQETDDYAAAEHAYQKSLNIEIEQKNVAGQASTIGQLGNLYDRMNRLEDAAAFHGQAADKFATLGDLANEGKARNNLAGTFRKLNRLTKARAQIRRAIECNEAYGHATQPWSFWETFCDIETAHDQPQAATATRQRALECFLSYRRDGGENHDGPGRLCAHMSEWLSLNKSDKASETLRTLWTDPNLLSHLSPLLDALDAIAAGSRDPALADNPALSYDQAAEIILLLERLNQPAAPANLPTTKP